MDELRRRYREEREKRLRPEGRVITRSCGCAIS
jgi:hypothetical protein